MSEELHKAIELARRTGDRLIIFDKSISSEPYVVMSMREYEKLATNRQFLLDLTEEELLDKINRDIAAWKSQEERQAHDLHEGRDFFANLSDKISNPMTSVKEVVDEMPDFGETREEIKKKASPWSIPSEIKEAAEEVIEEDRQYLEEI